jgi:hypothetical protein
MRREIQVHFENAGQLLWHEEIDDVDQWLLAVLAESKIIAYDKESGRHFGFDTKTVTAFIVSDKPQDTETDLWRRNYATCQGNIEEDDKQKHPRDGRERPSTKTSGSSCY